jgi:hypothetical protein
MWQLTAVGWAALLASIDPATSAYGAARWRIAIRKRGCS